MDAERQQRMLAAIRELNEVFGFETISVYSPVVDGEDTVQAFFMARDEGALKAACIDFLTPAQKN